MDLVTLLKSKKVIVTEIPKWGPYLREQWDRNFAGHLCKEEKKSIEGYLWHLFSYEKSTFIMGNEAI